MPRAAASIGLLGTPTHHSRVEILRTKRSGHPTNEPVPGPPGTRRSRQEEEVVDDDVFRSGRRLDPGCRAVN